jgi:hypothetical protein
MRFLKTFLMMVLTSAFLLACGGGGGDSGSGTSAGGGNTDSSLTVAYGKISGGMTLAQVKAIVGTEPNSDADAGASRLYAWTGGSPQTSQLMVTIHPTSGVKMKALSAPGNPYSSQNY